MVRASFEEYRSEDALASLEEDWLERIESAPGELDWFVGMARGFEAAGEAERARPLLELLDAELADRGQWVERLELLRHAADLFVRPSRLQREVLRSLEGRFDGRPDLAEAISYVGLDKATDDSARLWDKVTRLRSLLVYEVGAVVLMKGQGVGRVAEFNLPLESLKIDFEKRAGVTVGLRAAAKLLKPLPPGHLLRRKLEEPETLERLRDEDPPGLLRAVLETSDRAMTATEIREALAGVVPESRWSSWWATARRHPQVVASTGGRQSYRWEATEEGALDAVRRSFARAEPRVQAELLRKNAARDESLAREMAGALASIASERAADEPGLAFELWFALERAGLLPDLLGELPERLVGPEADVRRLLSGVEDRLLRERALAMIRERREDWVVVWTEQFRREEDARVLDQLADGLATGDSAALDRLLDDLLAQPRRAPAAFVWLAERAAGDDGLRRRAPLRLLQQLLAALASPEFGRYRARLAPLVESGGTLPRLFANLEVEHAALAADSIRRASGLERYQKEPLVSALELRFPSLRESARVGTGPLYATATAIESRQEELRRLNEVEIPANRKAIAEARAMGDLRENFEYKAARDRHEYLNARVAALHRDLGRARVIDFAALDTGEVRIGTRVRLEGDAGTSFSFAVLGPWDSRPEDGILSYESELGARLLGLTPGDTVEIDGKALRVAGIEPAG